jgi:hypothetical protein
MTADEAGTTYNAKAPWGGALTGVRDRGPFAVLIIPVCPK